MNRIEHLLFAFDDERLANLPERVADLFAIQSLVVATFQDLCSIIRNDPDSFRTVLLSDELPESKLLRHAPPLEKYINDFDQFPKITPVLVTLNEPRQLMESYCPRQPLWVKLPCNDEQLRQQLNVFLRNPHLPTVALCGPAQLTEQVRRLSENREIRAGKQIIAQLVSRFFDWRTVDVSQLAPGLSGARVFIVSGGDPRKSFVLKIAEAREGWKLELEAGNRPIVPGGAANSVRVHIPQLHPATRIQGAPAVASFGAWCALCYDYLGGNEFDGLLDLHRILTADDAEPPRKPGEDLETYRRSRLDALLSWLASNWYEPNAVRTMKKIWLVEDGGNKGYPVFPPYQLSGRHKSDALAFLASPDAESLGPRLFPGWPQLSNSVWDFLYLSDAALLPKGLSGEFPAILSAAHGDMNARNVMIWEQHLDHPFIIDFPTFQLSGHTLQDFARLEIEVRVQLMDQQTSTPIAHLPALGWTWSQINAWTELDNHLRGPEWESDFNCSSSDCHKDNVKLAFELTRDLRRRARNLQQRRLDGNSVIPGEFLDEYRPALLYHTLRAVGYSLPIFKRLFAVQSACELLNILGWKSTLAQPAKA